MRMRSHKPGLLIYSALSRLPGLQGYLAKIMAVTFLGIHLPLLGLVGFVLLKSPSVKDWITWHILLVVLGGTLLGTLATLFVLHALLKPILQTAQALYTFQHRGQLPQLPTHYTDAAGQLMRHTVSCTRQLDETLNNLTTYDRVTGMLNRQALTDRWPGFMEQVRQNGTQAVLCCLDIDHFSAINTLYGQTVGDQLLRAVAHRLWIQAGHDGLVAHLGSDDFAIALMHAARPGGDRDRVAELQHQFDTPMLIGQTYIPVMVRIGVARCGPPMPAELSTLLNHADLALHQAQQNGDRVQFSSPAVQTQVCQQLRLETELQQALEAEDLTLYYQPRVDLRQGQIVGVEALARWHNPRLGWVSPDEFIPLAEASNLINPLGRWALRTACQQHQQWRQSGLPTPKLSVNLSARQLQQPDLVEQVDHVLTTTGMDPQQLELEVTETFCLQEIPETRTTMDALRALGVTLALDDFGTGYSSLQYLCDLTFDVLKIDRMFTQGIPHRPSIAALTVALGHHLGLHLVVEGIETAAQYRYFQAAGCHEGQGHYFYPAMAVDDLTKQLVAQTVGPAR